MNAPIDMAKFAAQVCGMRTPGYMQGSEVMVNFRGIDLMVELDYEDQIEEISTASGANATDAFADWAIVQIRKMAMEKVAIKKAETKTDWSAS